MKNVKKHCKASSIFAATTLLASILLSSIVVFAYEDYPVLSFDEPYDAENTSTVFIVDDTVSDFYIIENEKDYFTPSTDVPFTNDINELFIEDGETEYYPVGEHKPDAVCVHSYISGTIKKHTKNNSGGCTMNEYSAQRCTKCGYTVTGSLIGSHTYPVCPH